MKPLFNPNFLWLYCLVGILFTSCAKDDISAEHFGSFSCLIDGVEWTPAAPSTWSGTPMQFQYYPDSDFIGIAAQRQPSDQSAHQSISFAAKPVKKGRNQLSYDEQVLLDWEIPGACGTFNIDSTTMDGNWIEIVEINPDTRKISGKFQLNLVSQAEDCEDRIRRIRDGHFSFHY